MRAVWVCCSQITARRIVHLFRPRSFLLRLWLPKVFPRLDMPAMQSCPGSRRGRSAPAQGNGPVSLTLTRPDWWSEAACRGRTDLLDRFVPLSPPKHVRAVKLDPELAAICATCPVSDLCLETGYLDRYAVRGGLTAAQRAKDRKAARQRERREDVRAG